MAISPNNGAFMLDLTRPVVKFFYLAVVVFGSYRRMLIMSAVVLMDDELHLTKQLDLVLNSQKLLTHTPKRGQIEKENYGKELHLQYSKTLFLRVEDGKRICISSHEESG